MRKSNIVDEAINQYLNTGDVSVLQNNLGPFDGELACEDDELAYCIKRSDLQGAIARIKKITNFSEDNKMKKDINDEFLDDDKYLVDSKRKDVVDDDNYVVKDFSELDDTESDSATDDKLDKIIKILELAQDDDEDLDLPESNEITVTEDFGDDSLGESDEEAEYEDDGADLASEEGLEDEDSEESDFEIDDDDTQEFSEKNFGAVGDFFDKVQGKTPETEDNKAFVNHKDVMLDIMDIFRKFIDELNLFRKKSHYVDKEEDIPEEDRKKLKLGYEKCLKETWEKIKEKVANFSSVNVVKIFNRSNLNFSDKVFLFSKNLKLNEKAMKQIYELIDKWGHKAYVNKVHPEVREKCCDGFREELKELLYQNYSYIKKGIKKLSTNFAGSESFKSAAELDLDEVAEQKKQDEKADYLRKQLDNTKKHKKLIGGSPLAKQDQDKYKKELSEVKSSKEKDKAYLEDKEKIASEEVEKEKEAKNNKSSNDNSSKTETDTETETTETTVNASVKRLLNYSRKYLEVINYGNFRKGI